MNGRTLRSDEDLVLEAQSGEVTAFEELMKRHQVGVRAEAFDFLRNHLDADDIMQDTFLSAFRKIDSLGPPHNFGAWVRQIARNKARNYLVRGPRFVSLDSTADCRTQDQEFEEEELYLTVANVIRALSNLSTPLRETSRLFYLSQISHRQIADRLQIPLGTVKRRLWESRLKIRKEVLKMSRKGRIVEPLNTAPAISVEDHPDEVMTIRSQGPGLYFGSRLTEGHSETSRFFDYPGGLLTLTVRSHVIRKVTIMGRNCYEVLVEHTDCEPPEANLLDYFEETADGYRWLMRVTADGGYPQTRFMKDDEEVFSLLFSAGMHTEYFARVAELTVGDREWGKCLVVWWAWTDGTPVESYYTVEGREVLRRRYVGPDAPVSRNYDYNKLSGEICRQFNGTEYRLWYDTVLMEP